MVSWNPIKNDPSNSMLCLWLFSSIILSCWHDIYSLALLSSVISSLILILDCVLVSFCKVMSLFNEVLEWMLIQGRFEFTITSSLFDIFELFVKCYLTVICLLFLDLNETFLPGFSWWHKYHDWLFYFCKIVSRSNHN